MPTRYSGGADHIRHSARVSFPHDACRSVPCPQRDCVLSIAQFLRQNPRASQAQINAEVEKNVLLFATRVKALETAPIL